MLSLTGAADGDAGRSAEIARRLSRSVLRPLERLIASDPTSAGGADDDAGDAPARRDASLEDQVWALARAATELRTQLQAVEVIEAAAALHHLVATSGDDDTAARMAELAALLDGAQPHIRVSRDGPYLVTRAASLTSWLGEPLPCPPQTALCRCGRSSMKPYCDGTHAEVGFSGDRDPGRIPDRRDTYVGQQVTIFDNRGICAHSGFCTDRLSSMFRAGEEPFVRPSGGRLDEIIKAVRSCPSGALSYALEGIEAREHVDSLRPVDVEVSRNGPYRVTGGLPLLDEEGGDHPRAEGSSREHYSLCRCGQSRNKPFCSGMHWYVRFADPVADPAHEPTLFEWAGGFPALLRMTRIFYGKYVPQDPLIGPLFAEMSPDHPERVASWLGEVFGGPKLYSERYGGYPRMISQHSGKQIREEQRARWASLLVQSADDAGLPADAEFRAAFTAYIEWGSRLAVENSQASSKPPPHMPMPRWWWVCDATPGARVSALAGAGPDEQGGQAAAPVLPDADETPSFDKHIKGLFRVMDRQSMKFVFDLWSHADVAAHGPAILARLRAGTMPCDGAWPADRVAVFERWIAAGSPP